MFRLFTFSVTIGMVELKTAVLSLVFYVSLLCFFFPLFGVNWVFSSILSIFTIGLLALFSLFIFTGCFQVYSVHPLLITFYCGCQALLLSPSKLRLLFHSREGSGWASCLSQCTQIFPISTFGSLWRTASGHKLPLCLKLPGGSLISTLVHIGPLATC